MASVLAIASACRSIVEVDEGEGEQAVEVDEGGGEQAVYSVMIEPSTADVYVDDDIQLTAIVRDAGGTVLVGRTITWLSSDSSVASVGSSGLVRGISLGTATITAQTDGRFGRADLCVHTTSASIVEVRPSFLAMDPGDSASLELAAFTACDRSVSSPAITWEAFSPEHAVVDETGMVRALHEGIAQIVGTVDDATDTMTIAILGSGSMLATAFPGDSLRRDVEPGSIVTISVVLDMRSASSEGDLGALGFELRFDPEILRFATAAVLAHGAGDVHSPTEGVVLFSLAHTAPQGIGRIPLAAIDFSVAESAGNRTESTLELLFQYAPWSTAFNQYSLPIQIGGRIRVIAP